MSFRRFCCFVLVLLLCLSIPFSVSATETETEVDATTPSRDHGGAGGSFDSDSEYQSGVLGWFERIRDGIIYLPQNLWNLISDGLMSLFVPSQSQITEMKDKWDNLMREQFGGLYQAVDVISGYAKDFTAREQKCIDFPVVSIPVGSGVNFEFGGWTVQIVPDGFDALIDAVKLATSVICTVAFVNMLRRRLENLLESEGE